MLARKMIRRGAVVGLAVSLVLPSAASAWSGPSARGSADRSLGRPAAAALQASAGAAALGGPDDLLPDLKLGTETVFKIMVYPNASHLRIGTTALNVGDGAFHVRGRRPSTDVELMNVKQRIFDTAGGYRQVDNDAWMEYTGDGHNHWHLQHFISMEVFKPSNPGTIYGLRKLGFCIIDEERRNPQLPNSPVNRKYYGQTGCGFPDSLGLNAGISVGWADIYPAKFVLQYIKLPKDLPVRRYRVCVMVDAQEQFLETKESNNFVAYDLWINVNQPGNIEPVAVSRTDCRP